MEQVHTTVGYVNSIISTYPNDPILLMGDFNSAPNSTQITTLISQTGLKDAYAEK